jgi:putative FmdB family regulatory protein
MPTYEYRCPKGHRFEKFHTRITSHRTSPCPTCGRRARRLVSGGAGLLFKGSGFYVTDYKRAGEAKGEKSAEQTTETKSSTTESKKKDSGAQ